MLNSIKIDGHTYEFDMSQPIDISIPLRFNGPQPNAFGVEPATSMPCAAGKLIGDTRQGGSCNFEQYTFIPHCNGTHTECVGHITHERIAVRECLQDVLVPAVLLSVEPESARRPGDTYSVAMADSDLVISRRILMDAFSNLHLSTQESEPGAVATGAFTALIIRTTPNSEEKLTRRYVDDIPPYFTTEAMQFLVESGVRHLLVDLPSIDRMQDEGRLSNHRIFWKIDQGSFELSEIARRSSTVTELVYVPNEVPDGTYILNLQIAPFESDASPSRPLLFRIPQN